MRALLLALALASTGCASLPRLVRVGAATGRVMCLLLCGGCPSTPAVLGARPVVAFDLLPDGGVRPVYAGDR